MKLTIRHTNDLFIFPREIVTTTALNIHSISKMYLIAVTLRCKNVALAGVAQQIECRPVNQRVTSSIRSLGHMHGLQARSLVGGA